MSKQFFAAAFFVAAALFAASAQAVTVHIPEDGVPILTMDVPDAWWRFRFIFVTRCRQGRPSRALP